MQKPKKTIALVEWNWSGHHQTHFNNFTLALEDLGFDVLGICPDPILAENLAKETRPVVKINKVGGGTTEYIQIGISSNKFRLNRSGRLQTVYWTIKFFKNIEIQIKEWSNKKQKNVAAIFYCCIYDWEFQWARFAQPFLSIPWAGLYLQARTLRLPGTINPVTGKIPKPEFMFGGALCKGIAILDEGKCDEASREFRKPVFVFPEMTDERFQESAEGKLLADQMIKFANGRIIVGLFGHLSSSKGVEIFLNAAKESCTSDVCFVMVGEKGWGYEREKNIQKKISECDNLWFHLNRIFNESDLNYLISKCHVLFASYIDFPHSSGIMTKAALFEKPIIVSEGFLMAERVRRFKLGEVIPQGDHGALLEAIRLITNKRYPWKQNLKPEWDIYRNKNSFECLKSSFQKMFSNFN